MKLFLTALLIALVSFTACADPCGKNGCATPAPPEMIAKMNCLDVCHARSYDDGLYAQPPTDRCTCINTTNGATTEAWGS